MINQHNKDSSGSDMPPFAGSMAVGSPGRYGFVEFTTDEEMRDALKPVFAGSELLKVLQPTEWGTLEEGEIKIFDQPIAVQEDAQEANPYIVAQDLTPSDVIGMVSRVLHPNVDGTES